MPHSKTVDVGHVRHESATTPLTAALAPKAPGERWTQALRWGLPGGRERQGQAAAAQWARAPLSREGGSREKEKETEKEKEKEEKE